MKICRSILIAVTVWALGVMITNVGGPRPATRDVVLVATTGLRKADVPQAAAPIAEVKLDLANLGRRAPRDATRNSGTEDR